jgi:hypothetical protein
MFDIYEENGKYIKKRMQKKDEKEKIRNYF